MPVKNSGIVLLYVPQRELRDEKDGRLYCFREQVVKKTEKRLIDSASSKLQSNESNLTNL